jgi:hypothetical protein
LSPDDNVVVARTRIAAGETLKLDGQGVQTDVLVKMGHKLARRPILAGEKILKYGAPIGSATTEISPGEHVHVHNMKSDYTPTHSLLATQSEHARSSLGGDK